MPTAARRKSRPKTVRDYQLARIFFGGLLLAGPILIFVGLRGNYRDRPSLQWPVTTGTVMQSESVYHSRKRSHYYDVDFTYSYMVDDRRYMGHKIKLYNPRFSGDRATVKNFVADYHVRAQVDVHYDPQYPENAVIFPGADESFNNFSIWGGSIVVVLSVLLNSSVQPKLRKLIVQKKAELTNAPKTKKEEKEVVTGLPHAFATYEPAFKRKLNCFEDKECLLDALGHDGQGIQEWTPEDRVIDSAGREYRLVQQPSGKKRYGIEPTGNSWSCERLLDVAVADTRLLKKDENALRRRVTDAPAEKRMAVLMKCIDELPAGPKWAIISLILFLIFFFLVVLVGTYKLVTWLQKSPVKFLCFLCSLL
jgi:hypothetical protein